VRFVDHAHCALAELGEQLVAAEAGRMIRAGSGDHDAIRWRARVVLERRIANRFRFGHVMRAAFKPMRSSYFWLIEALTLLKYRAPRGMARLFRSQLQVRGDGERLTKLFSALRLLAGDARDEGEIFVSAGLVSAR
jgi:hypothetical protein